MGVETWNDGYVNVWEGTTDRKVHLTGGGSHTVRSSNKAVTWLSIWDGAGNDDISVGALNTNIYANSGHDRYYIESGINATIYNGSGYKDVGSNYLAGSISVYETNWWSQRHVHVSAYNAYVQSGHHNDQLSAYGLSSAVIEDAGGNNTLTLSGAGFLKAKMGGGRDVVHLHTGWKTDLVKSGGSLEVHNHNHRGGDTSVWTDGGHWGSSLDNLIYRDASAWSHNIDLRVNRQADVSAYALAWNRINLWGSDGASRLSISSPGTNEIWATRGSDVINVWQGGRWTEVNLDHGNDELRNRVMTGNDDDLALVMGKTNALFMGDGNDAGLMLGEKNAWRGGKGNDLVLVGGKDNAVKGNEGNDLALVLGQTNKFEGGSGDDLAMVLGMTNDVDGGEGKDVLLVVGRKNNINAKAEDNTGDGDDTVLTLGLENTVLGGRGSDWLITCGMANAVDGGQGDDVLIAAGWKNTLHGDLRSADNGRDVLVFIGGQNRVQGNGGDDLLIGAGLGNQIEGNAGRDIVLAAGLAQSVDLGDGDDIAVALGAGNTVSAGPGQDTVYIAGALGNAFGGLGDDTLFALGAGNLLWGQGGNDLFLAQGMASRCLVADKRLPTAIGAIHGVLDRLNEIAQGIGAEAVPARLGDYARQDNTHTYAYGDVGDDTFFTGFQNLVADGGAGADTYHVYLGDGRCTVRDDSVDADRLFIHAESLSRLGSSARITASDLYYDSASRKLSVIQAGTTFAEIQLDGFGSGADQIALVQGSGSSTVSTAVALAALSPWRGATGTNGSPSLPSTDLPGLPAGDLTALHETLRLALAVDRATVLA